MKKKLLLPIFALALVGSLVACSGNDQPSGTSSSDAGSSSQAGSSDSGSGSDSGSSSIAPDPSGATAVGNYVNATIAEKTEILGKLEKYAVDNMITGLPLFDDSGYQIYQSRVVKGLANYIQGYGFGTLRYGRLDGTLSGDIGSLKPTYYHTLSSSDPATVNVWDNNGSQVSDFQSYMGAGYYGTIANEAGDGYEWVPILATKDRPWIVETNSSGVETAREATSNEVGTTWRIYVRTNDDGVTYRTGSSLADRKAFDGRKVVLEDYLTPYKILLTQGIGTYRGNELAGQTGKYAIAGAAEYFAQTANTTVWDDELFEKLVSVKTGTDSEGDYIQWSTLAPTNRFYAMYMVSDNLYEPIPEDFWNLVTNNGAAVDNWFSNDSNKTTTPVDNSLSVGPYYLESWEQNVALTFAKNSAWTEIDPDTKAARTGIYNIEGVYIRIVTAANDNPNAPMEQFLAGNIDACSLNSTYLPTYRSDPRTVKIPGSDSTKLNVNSCTQEEWIAKFGENGSVSQTAEADYYQCKPWMSNDDFVKALFYSVDRATLADAKGFGPCINYFGDGYMSDPENAISYNSTPQHEAAIEDFWGDTVSTYGYNVSLAHEFYNSALEDMIASGDVKAGDVLDIFIVWQSQSNITNYGTEIGTYFENTFNGCEVAQTNNITLKVENYAPAVWSDAYYQHMMVGQFDLGWGSITGNFLDPLNYMEVLKSDNSGGFTLNWGPDTSDVGVLYDNQYWSFDTLWSAADHGVCTYKGEAVAPATIDSIETSIDETSDSLVIDIAYTSGNKFLEEKADDPEVKAIIDSGQFDGRLQTVNFFDGTGYFLDAYATLDFETGEVELINGAAYASYMPDIAGNATVTWDATNETVKVVVADSFLEALYTNLDSVGYGAYYYMAYNFSTYQKIGVVEGSYNLADGTATDLSHWIPVAEEDPSSSSEAASFVEGETALVRGF